MRLFEAAKELDVDVVVLKKALKKKGHMCTLTKAELKFAGSMFAPEGVSFPPSTPSIDLALIEQSIRCLGNKSPLWEKRHLIGRE